MHMTSDDIAGQIRSPVLEFSQGEVFTQRLTGSIRQCTRLGYKKGYYNNLVIVDSDGRRFTVLGARVLRTIPPTWSLGGTLNHLLGPRLEVEMNFAPEPPTVLTLDEVKSMIFDCIERNSDFWDEMSDDFDEFRNRLARARSLQQVFTILGV
jgi:hypothetical protein